MRAKTYSPQPIGYYVIEAASVGVLVFGGVTLREQCFVCVQRCARPTPRSISLIHLNLEPYGRASAKGLGEADGHLRRNPALASDEVVERLGGSRRTLAPSVTESGAA